MKFLRTQEAIDSFMRDCELRELSENTRKEYSRHLKHLSIYLQQIPPRRLNIIQQVLLDVKGGPYNRHAHIRTYRRFANFCVDYFGIDNFMKGIRPPKIQRKVLPVISESELALVPWALEQVSPRDRALFCLFLDTALRQGEVCTLKREDFTKYGDDKVVVFGKTGYRVVPISPIAREFCLALPTHEDGYLFHGTGRYRNTPLGKRGIYDAIRKILRIMGWQHDKHGAHTLRRSHGYHHLKDGGNIKTVQLQLGHANIKTTVDYYLPMRIDDVVEMHHKHSPIKVFETAP